jgi:DNA-binding transcriptional ArsR family regulator
MGVTNDKQGEDGRFESVYDPEEFVDAVGDLDLPATADVADAVEAPHRTALHHLNKLEEAGRLTSRKVGAAKVWDVADDE